MPCMTSFEQLKSVPRSDLRSGKNHALQGVKFTVTLDELEAFVRAQERSLLAEPDFEDALERIRTLREVAASPHHHIVLRNGSAENHMGAELPSWLQSNQLRRITRGSRDGRTVDQVASGARRVRISTPRTGGWMAIAHPRPRRINAGGEQHRIQFNSLST